MEDFQNSLVAQVCPLEYESITSTEKQQVEGDNLAETCPF